MELHEYEAEVQASVARGMILLDRRTPGWEQEINVNALVISSACNCILGQIYGDYRHGRVVLGVHDPSGVQECNDDLETTHLGFERNDELANLYLDSVDEVCSVADFAYMSLQSAWEKALADRLGLEVVDG